MDPDIPRTESNCRRSCTLFAIIFTVASKTIRLDACSNRGMPFAILPGHSNGAGVLSKLMEFTGSKRQIFMQVAMDSFGKTLIRRLTPHNPLYIISAGLFLRGLRMLYCEEAGKTAPWTMLAMLAGYIVLVGALGVWVIRKITVWDDARTILLVVAVLLMSGSMLFDETVVQNAQAGTLLLAGSWLFSAAVSETLIRCSRLPLPLSFRLTWFGFLAVFHLWPALMSQVLYRNGGLLADSLSAAFPLAVSLAFVPMLANLRRWSKLPMPQGSGWIFPLYPLALFFLVGVAAGLRAPLLALSFGRGAAADSIFEAWMLLPLIVVAALTLIELAHIFAADNRWTTAALLFPLVLFFSPFLHLNTASSAMAFQRDFTNRMGSPQLWGIALTTLTYLTAAWRRLPYAELGVGVACAFFAFACCGQSGFQNFAAASGPPTAVLAVALSAAAIRSKHSTAVFAAAIFATGAASSISENQLLTAAWFGSMPGVWLAIAAAVLLSFADQRRVVMGWITGALLVLVGLLQQPPQEIVAALGSTPALAVWLVLLIAAGEILCRLSGTQGPRVGAIINLTLALGYLAKLLFAMSPRLSTGFRWILAGLFALIPAAAISYVKRPRAQLLRQ